MSCSDISRRCLCAFAVGKRRKKPLPFLPPVSFLSFLISGKGLAGESQQHFTKLGDPVGLGILLLLAKLPVLVFWVFSFLSFCCQRNKAASMSKRNGNRVINVKLKRFLFYFLFLFIYLFIYCTGPKKQQQLLKM